MNATKVDFMGYLLSLAQVQNYKLNLDVDFLSLSRPMGSSTLSYRPHLKGGFPPDLSTEGQVLTSHTLVRT